MIIARNLRLSFGAQPIFSDISFTVQGTERVGLFGLNGSGKSTLLKVIAGGQKLEGGAISIIKGSTVAYLPQEVTLRSDKSIIDETMMVFGDLNVMQARSTELEQKIAETPGDLVLLDEYAQLCEQIAAFEPEQKRASAERMLIGLGFPLTHLKNPVQALSVGWKMRVVLAKLLLQNADFYLFDEPTNHLDIVAKEWFLNFLENSSFGFMLVCHEKRFLNRLCTKILELERGIATFYSGDYDDYVQQKQEMLTRLESAYENQQRELKRMHETIDRFKAKASKARMAQSMMKKLDKIERVAMPPDPRKINFNFAPLERSGKIALNVHAVAHSFDTKQVFKNATFTLERGSKVAIVAANGVGKTTLLNVISERIPLQAGSVELGYKATVAVFDQDQTASLDLSRSVIDNAFIGAGDLSEQMIRSMLGAFLFTNESINKKAGVLSGGERNRLGMVRALLRNANLLLLDEPTNHLDIPSKDMLLSALQSYAGTILFVSHDHDFVNELATHIIELTPSGTILYHGSYDEYLYQKQYVTPSVQEHKPEPVATSAAAESETDNKNSHNHELRKKIRSLEQKIEKLEQEISNQELLFADLTYGSPDFVHASDALNVLKKQHKTVLAEWELLHGQ
jgi:ATP-binding cassette, subfamily F, member 3